MYNLIPASNTRLTKSGDAERFNNGRRRHRKAPRGKNMCMEKIIACCNTIFSRAETVRGCAKNDHGSISYKFGI